MFGSLLDDVFQVFVYTHSVETHNVKFAVSSLPQEKVVAYCLLVLLLLLLALCVGVSVFSFLTELVKNWVSLFLLLDSLGIDRLLH